MAVPPAWGGCRLAHSPGHDRWLISVSWLRRNLNGQFDRADVNFDFAGSRRGILLLRVPGHLLLA
jgi:hypothetical protein